MLEKIQTDLKTALIAGEKFKVEVLRGLVAVIKTAQIDQRKDLTDDEIVKLLQKESKRRVEAAEMYKKGNADDRAESELKEKDIIEGYLPEQMSEAEIENIVDEAIAEINPSGMSDMGKVIGLVKQKTGAGADGAVIASVVKRKLV